MYHLKSVLAFGLLGFTASVSAVPVNSTSEIKVASASQKGSDTHIITRPCDKVAKSRKGRCSSNGTAKVMIHNWDKTKKPSKGKLSARKSQSTDFEVTVNWSDLDDVWTKPEASVAKASHITDFRLGKSESPIYDYYFEIYGDKIANYHFIDATGDEYGLAVRDTSSAHVVRFDSDAPRIVQIRGTINPKLRPGGN